MTTQAQPEASPAELASAAAETIRSLIYATMPGDQRLTYPSDVYEVLGTLRMLGERIPQANEQLARFLVAEVEAGRVRAAGGQLFADEPEAAVTAAEEWLAQASAAAVRLAECWNLAQTTIAGLAYADPTAEGPSGTPQPGASE